MSLLIHLGVLWLILREVDYAGLVVPIDQGAGGPGPAGGGGGSSARMEIIQYVTVQPPPPPTPKPVLVFKAPEIKIRPTVLEPLRLEPIVAPGINAAGSAVDPTGGAGPGSGGGVGTGAGTGKGSSVGPGTGGGEQANFPPEPDQMFLPPFPVPPALKGKSILAELDVDEKGKVVGVKFAATGVRAYDRRLAEVLRGYHFRPGHRPDGTPIRMKYQLTFVL
ncbi:MAG: hypothetical protein AABZ80_04645 [Gemmatimonadota bacterium]